MIENYNQIICIHPKDSSTEFLKPIGELFDKNYYIVEDNDENHHYFINLIRNLKGKCLIVFLGHGRSSGLNSAHTVSYPKRIFINKDLGNEIFIAHDLFFLCCNSSDYSKLLHSFNSIIAFGNILSSKEEVNIEADYSGVYRDLEEDDITNFNKIYVFAIKSAFKLLLDNKITFHQVKNYIEYFLNKEINKILLEKEKSNRIEISTLCFELRNEMILKVN